MTRNRFLPRNEHVKVEGHPLRRRTAPFTRAEAFHTIREMRQNPTEGPCAFACGSCLLCRIHMRAMKDAEREKSTKRKAAQLLNRGSRPA